MVNQCRSRSLQKEAALIFNPPCKANTIQLKHNRRQGLQLLTGLRNPDGGY